MFIYRFLVIFQPNVLKQNNENVPTDKFKAKRQKIIKTVKTQQSTQNCTTPDDDQKSGRKRLGRRYGTIPLLSRSRHKKNNWESWKNKIKNNKQCPIVFNKSCLNRYINFFKYIYLILYIYIYIYIYVYIYI